MNAPLDIDRGPEHNIRPQRQEHSCASIEAICESEALKADSERLRRIEAKAQTFIELYEKIRDQMHKESVQALDAVSAVSFRNRANLYNEVIKDLRQVIR